MALSILGQRPRFRADGGRIETIYLYDVIGADLWGEGIAANTLVPWIGQLTGVAEIELRINSAGGDVFDGLAIFNALVRAQKTIAVNSYIDGMAWSIAGVIAMAGATVTIAANASFMIHNPWAIAAGDADEFRKLADQLDQTKENLIDAYQRHTNAGRKALSDWMNAETWYNAEETVAAGFAGATEQAYPIAACFPAAFRFRNLPHWINKGPAAARPQYERRAVEIERRKRQFTEKRAS